MRIDLFELIDGFFKGVVHFLYNIVATTVRLFRHPFKAPSALFLLHQSKKRRQIGGTTFLFLLFFAFFALADLPTPGRRGAMGVLGGQASPVEVDLQAFWPATLAALVSTTVADAAIRLYLRIRLAGRPTRAEATLNMVEYSLLWLLAGIIAQIFLAAGAIRQQALGVVAYLVAVILGLGLALFASLPAVAMLQTGLRATRLRNVRPARRWLSAILHGLMVWAIAFSALLAGIYLVILPEMDRGMEAMRASDPTGKVQVLELSCALAAAHPYADALLLNGSNQALFLHPRDIRVRVVRIVPIASEVPGAASAGPRDVALFVAADPDAEPVLLQPGTASAVRIGLRGNARHAIAAGEHCGLSGPDPRNDLFGGG